MNRVNLITPQLSPLACDLLARIIIAIRDGHNLCCSAPEGRASPEYAELAEAGFIVLGEHRRSDCGWEMSVKLADPHPPHPPSVLSKITQRVMATETISTRLLEVMEKLSDAQKEILRVARTSNARKRAERLTGIEKNMRQIAETVAEYREFLLEQPSQTE